MFCLQSNIGTGLDALILRLNGHRFRSCSIRHDLAESGAQNKLQLRLEKETPKNHLDMRHRLDKEGKRWGKVIDYRQVKDRSVELVWLGRQVFLTLAAHRLSELRALTILEGLCGDLSDYGLVDGASSSPAGLQIWQKQQQRADTGLEGRPLKAHQQAQNELKHFCNKILEDHEEEITLALQEQGSPLLSGEYIWGCCGHSPHMSESTWTAGIPFCRIGGSIALPC